MLTLGQTEGICLRPSSLRGYISSEQISSLITIPPKLFSFNFEQFVSNSTVALAEGQGQIKAYCYPNPFQSKVFLSNYKGEFQLYSALKGELLHEGLYDEHGLDFSALPKGLYLLKGGYLSFKIVKF